MQTEKQDAPVRKMTDEDGRDMGESMRRLKGLFEKAPQKIEDMEDPLNPSVVKQDV